jgi:hypothetical protein
MSAGRLKSVADPACPPTPTEKESNDQSNVQIGCAINLKVRVLKEEADSYGGPIFNRFKWAPVNRPCSRPTNGRRNSPRSPMSSTHPGL